MELEPVTTHSSNSIRDPHSKAESKYRTAYVSRKYPICNATTCLSILQNNSKNKNIQTNNMTNGIADINKIN
jgi:hypothetical protein